MKRILIEGLSVLLLGLFIFAMMRDGGVSGLSAPEIEKHLQEAGLLQAENKAAERDIKRKLRLDASAYEGVVYYTGSDFMDVSEFLLIKAGDETRLDEVEAAVSAYLEKQKTTFENYGTNQFDLLEHAHIWRRGDYFLLTVGENGEALWNAARKEIER